MDELALRTHEAVARSGFLTSVIVFSTNLNLRRLRELSLMAQCKRLAIRVLTITPSNLKLSFGVVRVEIIPNWGEGGKI